MIARHTEAVIDAVLGEVGHFEDGAWYGDRALAVADVLAKAEYDNEILRAVGEEIGDVDNHNRATAYAGTARRVAAALHELVYSAAAIIYPDGAPLRGLLWEVWCANSNSSRFFLELKGISHPTATIGMSRAIAFSMRDSSFAIGYAPKVLVTCHLDAHKQLDAREATAAGNGGELS